MSNYLSDEDYNFIYSKAPRICVDLLIKNKEGKIFLTKRDIEPYLGHWHFPGGRIKFRETIADAVRRIAKGELGYDITDAGKVVGVCEFLEEYQQANPRHSISLVHLIEVDINISVKNGVWFNKIPDPMIPPQKEFLLLNNIL